jgi:hypothetical protein
MSRQHQADRWEDSVPGLERPRWLFLVTGGLVLETGQVFALAARKASGRPGGLRTVPLDAGPDVGGWPTARRKAVLTALLSAAPNTVVVDIDMQALAPFKG